jgi:hypothetical protein
MDDAREAAARRRAVLNVRHAVLIAPSFPSVPLHAVSAAPSHDPFEFETRGVFVAPFAVSSSVPTHAARLASSSNVPPRKKNSESWKSDNAANGRAKGKGKGKGKGSNRLHRKDIPGIASGRVERNERKKDGVAHERTRRPRATANWNEDQDRVLRKCLRKWGWGCWKRISLSGRLPKHYTPRMISNHANILQLQERYAVPSHGTPGSLAAGVPSSSDARASSASKPAAAATGLLPAVKPKEVIPLASQT